MATKLDCNPFDSNAVEISHSASPLCGDLDNGVPDAEMTDRCPGKRERK